MNKKLSELVVRDISYGVLKPGENNPNGVPLVRINNISKSNTFIEDDMIYITNELSNEYKRTVLTGNELLFSVVGSIGRILDVPSELSGANISRALAIISPTDEINKKYLYYYLQSPNVNRYIEKEMQGNAQKVLNLSVLRNLDIPILPLKEQQKIADILSSVDAAIEKTEQVIAKTEEVKKGLMQQLLTKGIGHTEFKDSKVGLIPKSWHLIDFIGVADSNIDYSFTGGPFGSDLKSEDYTENGVRIIQLQNIKDGYFNDDYKIFTSEEKANKLKSCNIYPGEIIIAKMADPLARACLVPDKDSRYLMASDGIRLSIDKCKFDTNFVLYSINSIYFRNQAEEVSTGTTRLRIGLSALKKLQFKVPPLEEQKRISSIILSFDNKIKSEQEKLIKLKECKKGLMQQLLTGQVRVKID